MTRQYQIPGTMMKTAWELVKANKGAAGVDRQTIEDFEGDLEDNLYRIWNRMTSGSYFPPAVRTVEIPKDSGGKRLLGIPTVADRVAQTVAKMYIEPEVEPKFHRDSYGYRPRRGQHDAIATARARCWKYDWVLEVDIKGYFDQIPHDLMMELLRMHTQEQWVLLYVERWLKADLQNKDGTREKRAKGSPQGSVISPLLSNIFLHHVFDTWMEKNYPNAPFERFADDLIVHCTSLEQAISLKEKIEERLRCWRLELNTEKTKIVYCRDSNRTRDFEHIAFTFLGYTFKPRKAKNRETGTAFASFLPAISQKAKQRIFAEIRAWKLLGRLADSLEAISKTINPQIRGWLNYYGKFYRSALIPIANHIDCHIVRWAIRKYKSLKGSIWRGHQWLEEIRFRQPGLFAHWIEVPRLAG